MNIDQLRSRHPRFRYRSYAVRHEGSTLTFEFDFLTEPDLVFRPKLEIDGVDAAHIAGLQPGVLENLAFHVGLSEMPSYWKATCSPEVVVEAASLDDSQLEWWHDLFMKGMGEYFFVNRIDFTPEGFVSFRADRPADARRPVDHATRDPRRHLALVGGGKDSALAIEMLKSGDRTVHAFAINPTRAAERVIDVADAAAPFTVRRTLDPLLFQLNREGYLNGHVPFSAFLAFASLACAALFDYGRIVVANERSSNEGNVEYLGHHINHQYSKSFEFERSFREYVERNVSESISFFSFVRPLYELQISALFARMPKYHEVFRSCNRGQSANVWCGKCPKCLFVYTSLYPFLDRAALERIFGADLFERDALVEIAYDLLGLGEAKPFECVGTHDETLIAFYLAREHCRAQRRPAPIVLRRVEEAALGREVDLANRAQAILSGWNDEHALPEELVDMLLDATRELRFAPVPAIGTL